MNTATWVAIEHPYEPDMWEGWQFINETEGPWQDEPHAARVLTADMPALVLRNRFGVWCGYVGVHEGHWAYGRSFSDDDLVMGIEVHGGLTDASDRPRFAELVGVPGAKLWWLGFDCNHAWDYSPSMDYLLKKIGHERDPMVMQLQTYRTIDYAVEEVVDLARQLASEPRVTEGPEP